MVDGLIFNFDKDGDLNTMMESDFRRGKGPEGERVCCCCYA